MQNEDRKIWRIVVFVLRSGFIVLHLFPKEFSVSTTVSKRPVVIIVRDGWGKNPYPQWNNANAVYLAKHPVADRLMAEYPNTLIHTSGFDVGLPEGTMGNSEVGHQNIGAGASSIRNRSTITKEIRNGAFFYNPQLNAAVDNALKNNSTLHLFGIVSDARRARAAGTSVWLSGIVPSDKG